MATTKPTTKKITTSAASVTPKLLPAPKETSYPKTKAVFRLSSTLIFAILGFNFANSEFFRSYPLFGINYLTQVLITPLSALAGYYIVFAALNLVRKWFERLVVNTVVEVVSNFWYLQSKKIQEQRRVKQKDKSDKEKYALDAVLKTAILVDTSALIDGRIIELAKLNFLDAPIIVAQEVIDELHLLSDNKDTLKRQKGRRGLDSIKEIKKKSQVIIKKVSNGNGATEGVDKVLVNFAKASGVKLLTLDFNLAKVAGVSGVKVLNINELANAIKTVLLPGESLEVEIIQEGKEKNQGIAYLNDGTMLIVDGGKDKVGQKVVVTVVKVIQSPAGKIIFCKI